MPPPLDVIQNLIGAFGKYQFMICFFLFLSKFFIAFHQIGIVFLAPKVKYTCKGSETATCPCPDPVYDKSIFTNTMVMEWDLICSKAPRVSLAQTIFQLGTLIGSVCFGTAADRYGRKIPLLVAVIMQLSAGVICSYIPEYWTFLFIRWIIGLSVGGTMVITFVIIMEFVGTQYRDTISALYQVPFNLGHMLLALISYFVRDFRQFQLAISAPAVIMLTYFVMIPESPRWLIAVRRTERAITILEKVAKWNNKPVENVKPQVEAYQAALQQSQLKKGSIVDLFRTPNIRKNIIVMSVNWLACSYSFYGMSQYIGQLGGNVFINVALCATFCMCGSLSSIPLMKVMGRKTVVILFHYTCAGCLILLALKSEGPMSIFLACVGTVSSFIVFVVVYLYCSEMFPTVVRNAAVGFSSMMARVGSMVAPFVIDTKEWAKWMPPIGFAILPFIAGTLTFLFLPETKGCELLTTIEEGERFGKKTTTPPSQPVEK